MEIKVQNSKLFIYYLILTAMLCGALVMVIEVLGSRVLGPFFGVSLFVWTSLITITLVALAGGYAAGGIVSDKRETPDYLYSVILGAGFMVFIIPLLKGFALKACLPLGLRLGSLVSALVLFGPSLFLLGCVSPYIIKISAKEMKNIGRTVGVFYAISTVGSFLGTILTGFVFIAYFGVDRIFEIAGFLLVCLSLIYFLVFRKKWYLLLISVFLFFLQPADSVKSKIMSNGIKITKVLNKDTFYGNLKVLDYSDGNFYFRELYIDSQVQGGIDLNNRLPIYEFLYFLELLPYGLNPNGENCLVIGLGAGLVPMWYEKMGIKTDVVDIDPEVVAAARDYFGFHVSGEVIISDARYFLINSNKKYDYIIMDVFNGDTTPVHILSIEALKLLSERLTARGSLAINLIGSLKEETFMTASIIKTLEQVFKTVEIYPIFSPEEEKGWGNIEVLAYNYPPIPLNSEIIKNFPVHPLASKDANRFFGKKYYFPQNTPAIILSDNYNPIDFYDRWIKETVRNNILKDVDWGIITN